MKNATLFILNALIGATIVALVCFISYALGIENTKMYEVMPLDVFVIPAGAAIIGLLLLPYFTPMMFFTDDREDNNFALFVTGGFIFGLAIAIIAVI
jgi:hypothetical protein